MTDALLAQEITREQFAACNALLNARTAAASKPSRREYSVSFEPKGTDSRGDGMFVTQTDKVAFTFNPDGKSAKHVKLTASQWEAIISHADEIKAAFTQ